ncbi:MAG: hypothetical protein IMZ44_18970 [Planctomycetes bacterium]|nr:hypothetical protein [Planctomycetota bacterium]
MRSVLVLLVLSLSVALCPAAERRAPKTPGAQPKAPQPQPKAAEPQPPEPFVEPQTGVVFPLTMGRFTFAGSQKYDKPELGVSIRYKASEPVSIRADIYVYDLGKKDLGNGIESEAVKAAFEQAKADITRMETTKRYKDVKPLPQEPVVLKVGEKELPMLGAAFEFTMLPPPGTSASPEAVASHLFLTGYKDKFLKVRLTYPKAGKEKCAEALAEFMAALGAALK